MHDFSFPTIEWERATFEPPSVLSDPYMCIFPYLFIIFVTAPMLLILGGVFFGSRLKNIKFWVNFWLYASIMCLGTVLGLSIGGAVVFEQNRTPFSEVCHHISEAGLSSPIFIGAIIGFFAPLLFILAIKINKP